MKDISEKKQYNSPVVYILDTDELVSSPLTDEMCSYLPEYRTKKAEKYLRISDRIACQASFFLLVYGLRQLGINILPDIAFGEYGKPYFPDLPIRFNISHCCPSVCCGISNENIGVDIQDITYNCKGLVSHVMSAKEEAEILSSEDPDIAFTRLWCMKESFVKFDGTGISEKLKETDLSNVSDGSFFMNRRFSITRYKDYFLCTCTEKSQAVFVKKTLAEYLADIR